MIKTNMRIEIVSSSLASLSSMSQESREAIYSVLAKNYSSVRITLIDNLADLELLVARKPDLVFLGMKFLPQNPLLGLSDTSRIWLGEYLDRHGIAYTGSNHEAHKLDVSKPLAKQKLLNEGLQTAPFSVFKSSQLLNAGVLPIKYPVFIKPSDRGGGAGIDSGSIANNFAELESKVQSITTELQSDALVEQYLPGREFSIALLMDGASQEYRLLPIELSAPLDKQGASILSSAVKSSNAEVVSAVSDVDLKAKVCWLAINAFEALGGRDYGRIDVRLDEFGVPHFLEANLLPSLISGYGSFPKACEINLGLDYEAMLLTIVNLALNRKAALTVLPEPLELINVPLEPVLEV